LLIANNLLNILYKCIEYKVLYSFCMHAFMENQLLFLPNAKGMVPCLIYWLSPIEYTSVHLMQTLSFVSKDATVHGYFYALDLLVGWVY
jgi:hypothetical protein